MTHRYYTHKGWFGICPIYIGELGSEQGPLVEERHWSLMPLFWISTVMFKLVALPQQLLREGYAPSWPVRVTGELPEPIPLRW